MKTGMIFMKTYQSLRAQKLTIRSDEHLVAHSRGR